MAFITKERNTPSIKFLYDIRFKQNSTGHRRIGASWKDPKI